ncbi:MAG: alpha/beta hydrolase [Rhizobiales bacterium]|nr:alpha/beta hydrolase [Hyphomicrobiales bacterium]
MDRGKYATLLDEDLWAYIDRVDSWYPPGIAAAPIERQREVYDAMARAFRQGRPEGVEVDDDTLPADDRSIPIRRYRMKGGKPQAAVVYYHGGGFILGGLESHDDICAELCAGTGFEVVSVDYRLAPEHRHPAAFEDAMAAFAHVATATGLPLVLCGDSAGGNLAAVVAHANRGGARTAVGQVLIYPALGGEPTGCSYVRHADAPLLSVKDMEFYHAARTGGENVAEDPTLEPLADTDFSSLPATIVVTAECDPLSSDGDAYCRRILEAGGKAFWREEPRLVHSFLRARRTVSRAQAAFEGIIAAVAALGRNEWPY